METLESYKAVISIAEIRPPKNGRGRSYSVYTIDGNELSIYPDKLGLIRTGERYEVEVTDKKSEHGRIYRDIVSVKHLPAAHGQFIQAGLPARPQPIPQPPTNGSQKMDQQYWTPKPRDPDERKQIWVCALLARDMEMMDLGRGFMSEQELIARGEIHARVWDRLFGADVIARE
jgi:hypothetical protein